MPTTAELFETITNSAEGAFKDGWDAVRGYAPAEFKKMAFQLAEIVENVAAFKLDDAQGYSPATGKLLFRMQVRACEAVLVATTQLTLIAVQKALNAIIAAIKNAFSAALTGLL
jgi:hypothetical protein